MRSSLACLEVIKHAKQRSSSQQPRRAKNRSDVARKSPVLAADAIARADTGGTINWLSGTGDQFGEKSFGFRLNSLVGPPAITGIVIVIVGIVLAL